MGISAMIPTCIHLTMFLQATWRRFNNLYLGRSSPG
jgi:hypothetical protein